MMSRFTTALPWGNELVAWQASSNDRERRLDWCRGQDSGSNRGLRWRARRSQFGRCRGCSPNMTVVGIPGRIVRESREWRRADDASSLIIT